MILHLPQTTFFHFFLLTSQTKKLMSGEGSSEYGDLTCVYGVCEMTLDYCHTVVGVHIFKRVFEMSTNMI